MFTYAYSFNKAGLIIDWLKPKLNKMALTQKPVVRNPKMDTGYVKSLYFTFYFLQIRKLFNLKNEIWKTAVEINKRMILNEIPNFDTKMENGRRLKKYQDDLKKQRELDSKAKKMMPYQKDSIKRAGKVSNVADTTKKAKISKLVNTVKNSKVVKRK